MSEFNLATAEKTTGILRSPHQPGAISVHTPGVNVMDLPDGKQAAALKAKDNCPVSKLLNAHITLDARLESRAGLRQNA